MAELLAQLVATWVGIYVSREEAQYDLLRRLQDQSILPREIAQLFGEVRRAGNAASHAFTGDHHLPLVWLRMTRQLGVWFHRTFADPAFKSGPFFPPAPPRDESAEVRAKLTSLRRALAEYQAAHQQATEHLAGAEAKLREAKDERTFWEQMAVETEQAKVALEQKLVEEQQKGLAQPKASVASLVTAAAAAASAVELDEADRRSGGFVDASWEEASRVRVWSREEIQVILTSTRAATGATGRADPPDFGARQLGAVYHLPSNKDLFIRLDEDRRDYPERLQKAADRHFGRSRDVDQAMRGRGPRDPDVDRP